MGARDPEHGRPRFKLCLRSRDIWLPPGRYAIGRSSVCHIVIAGPLASRTHATLLVTEDMLAIEDLGSINGTYVNGERLTRGARRVHEGDRITLAGEELVVAVGVPTEREERETADTFVGDDAIVPVGRDLPEEETARGPIAPPTERRDAFLLLGEIAERALQVGRPEDAERVLGNHLRAILAGAEAGTLPYGQRLATALAWGLRLAQAMRSAEWLSWAIALLEASGRPPPDSATVVALELAVASVGQLDRERLAGYAARLRVSTAALEIEELARLDVIEALLARGARPRAR